MAAFAGYGQRPPSLRHISDRRDVGIAMYVCDDLRAAAVDTLAVCVHVAIVDHDRYRYSVPVRASELFTLFIQALVVL